MGEAWIYSDRAADAELAGELMRSLAELGFAPRKVAINGSLRPEGDGGAPARPPDLALVLGDRDLCARLEGDEDLGDVPLVVAVDPDRLEDADAVHEGHELIVLPLRPGE